MKKTGNGYEFVCDMNGSDLLSLAPHGSDERGVFFNGPISVRLGARDVSDLIGVLTRLQETGSMHPKKTEVERLKEQNAALLKKLAAAHKTTAPSDDE